MNEFEVVITNWWSGITEVEIVEEESIERLIAILGCRFEGLRRRSGTQIQKSNSNPKRLGSESFKSSLQGYRLYRKEFVPLKFRIRGKTEL